MNSGLEPEACTQFLTGGQIQFLTMGQKYLKQGLFELKQLLLIRKTGFYRIIKGY